MKWRNLHTRVRRLEQQFGRLSRPVTDERLLRRWKAAQQRMARYAAVPPGPKLIPKEAQ